MRLLLDTNIVLPVIHERVADLQPAIREALASASNSHYVSVASVWEIALKVRLGKLDLRPSLAELPDLLSGLRLSLLRIELSHVLAEISPLPETRDPFDRLLLAQSLVEGLRLVTLDRALSVHPLAWRPV